MKLFNLLLCPIILVMSPMKTVDRVEGGKYDAENQGWGCW